MKSMLNYINESLNNESLLILETLQEPNLIRLDKQIRNDVKEYNKNIKAENIHWYDTSDLSLSKIIGNWGTNHGIEWDKITNKELTIYEPDDKQGPATVYKLLKDSSSFIGIILIENPNNNEFTDICIRNDYYGKSFKGLKLGKYGKTQKTISDDKISYIKQDVTGKRIYVYDCQNLPTVNKRIARETSRQGMINYDDKSLREILDANKKRYAKAIREINAKKNTARDTEIINRTKRVINKVFDLLTEFNTLTPPIKVLKLVEKCGGLDWGNDKRGIIKILYEYLDAKQNAGNYDFYEDKYKASYSKLKNILNEIEKSINEIYDEM